MKRSPVILVIVASIIQITLLFPLHQRYDLPLFDEVNYMGAGATFAREGVAFYN